MCLTATHLVRDSSSSAQNCCTARTIASLHAPSPVRCRSAAMHDPITELPLGAVIRPQELTRGGVPAAQGQAQLGPLQVAWGSARHAAGEQQLATNATVVASYADWAHPMAASTSWAFSGQHARPASLGGPVVAAVASRLEAWNQHLAQHWQPVSRHISVAPACAEPGACDRVLLHWAEAAGPADSAATQPVPLAVSCGAPEPASVRILFHSVGQAHGVQSHGEHCNVHAHHNALSSPALLPAAEPPAPATLARSLSGMGLHRTLGMRVEADVPTAAMGEGQSASACWLTAVHRLQRSQYFDLDELREVERYGGPALSSALYAIDVERPTADSDQHVVLTKQVLPWLAQPLEATATLPANHTQLQQVAWPRSNATSDADAVLGASPFAADAAHALRASSISPAASAGQVHIAANITLPWHVRYQLQGCSAGEEQPVSSSDELAVRAAHAWLAPAAHPDAPRQVMASCFRAVHLPLATLHVQCGTGPVVPLRVGSAWPADVRTQAGQLSAPRSWYNEQGGPAPMPVAVAAHAGMVTPVTVGVALSAALLILAALRQVRTLKPE